MSAIEQALKSWRGVEMTLRAGFVNACSSMHGLALWAIACLDTAGRAQEMPLDAARRLSRGGPGGGAQGLQLAVYINDVNTDFVGTFEQLPDGSLTAEAG